MSFRSEEILLEASFRLNSEDWNWFFFRNDWNTRKQIPVVTSEIKSMVPAVIQRIRSRIVLGCGSFFMGRFPTFHSMIAKQRMAQKLSGVNKKEKKHIQAAAGDNLFSCPTISRTRSTGCLSDVNLAALNKKRNITGKS